jgi:hypothetical protein
MSNYIPIFIVSAMLAVLPMQLMSSHFTDTKKMVTAQASDLLSVNSDLKVYEVKFDDYLEAKMPVGQPEAIKLEALSYEKTQTPIKVEIGSISPIVDTPKLKENYLKYKDYYSADNTCHPYIMAGIHYRETTFGNTNAWNGQGAFQNTSNRYASNSIVDNWQEQVKQACLHLKGKIKVQTLLDPSNEDALPKALAKYNGCAGLPWNECSYVVNKTTLLNGGWKCAVDGCAYKTYDNKAGALSIIKQLIAMNL